LSSTYKHRQSPPSTCRNWKCASTWCSCEVLQRGPPGHHSPLRASLPKGTCTTVQLGRRKPSPSGRSCLRPSLPESIVPNIEGLVSQSHHLQDASACISFYWPLLAGDGRTDDSSTWTLAIDCLSCRLSQHNLHGFWAGPTKCVHVRYACFASESQAVPNFIEEMHFRRFEEKCGCQCMHRSVSPSLICKAV
jgi:hypothetical protein